VHEPGVTYEDSLHFITGPGYYAGHPNPTRANPNNSFDATNPQSPVTVGNPIESDFLVPGPQSLSRLVQFDPVAGQATVLRDGLPPMTRIVIDWQSRIAGIISPNPAAGAPGGVILVDPLNPANDRLLSDPAFPSLDLNLLDVDTDGTFVVGAPVDPLVFAGPVSSASIGSAGRLVLADRVRSPSADPTTPWQTRLPRARSRAPKMSIWDASSPAASVRCTHRLLRPEKCWRSAATSWISSTASIRRRRAGEHRGHRSGSRGGRTGLLQASCCRSTSR
jgi:hypothetical protein